MAAFQNSLALDGSGDYVQVPNSPALNPTDQLTIEAWVRRTSIGCQTIVGKNYHSSYWLGFCNDKIRFYTGGGTGYYHDGNTSIPSNVWTHIAVIWVAPSVGPTAEVRYYINGELDYSGSSTGLFSSTTSPLYIGADIGDSPSFLYEFAGNLAEVRIWNVARSQDDIRRTMHVALDEPRPGLVAVWHLTDDYKDSIGSNHGTARGNAALTGPQAPPRPALAPIDQNFSRLPQTRYGAATAYVSAMNRAVLVGGYGGGGYSASVDFVDPSSGYLFTAATLPGGGREDAVAAFATANDTVYVFGGYTAPSTYHSTIYAINPHSGAVRTLAATLPFGMTPGAAIYHPRLNKIYILGGASASATWLNTIYVFDPATETIAPFTPTPTPAGLDDFAAAYSSATGQIYIFGGNGPTGILSSTYAIEIGANPLTGTLRAVTTAPLPGPNLYMRAVEDPVTHLIYVIGGTLSDRVLAFDPLYEQLWETPMQLPERREAASLVYDSRNRQAVLMGGRLGATPKQDIWRIPLGDGPQIALGRWDFPQPGSLSITAINGSGRRVLVGQSNGTLSSYNSDGSRNDWALGSAVNDARYNAENDHLWAATNSGGGKLIVGGSVTTIYSDTQQMWAIDLRPGYLYTNSAPFFGTKNSGLQWPDWWYPSSYFWRTTFPNSTVRATTHRALGDLWAIVNGNLQRMIYTPTAEYDLVATTNYGLPCSVLYNAQDLTFDRSGDLWVVSPNYPTLAAQAASSPARPTIDGQGVCQIMAPTGAHTGLLRTPEVGAAATAVDVDADGRIWVSVKSQYDETGGLMTYQNLSGTVRSAATNWLTGPVGSLISVTSGSTVVGWKSGISAVGAAEERVWAGKEGGQLVTVAPRWQQLDEVSNLRQQQVYGVWTARGRLFAATISGTVFSLYVLMPDGKTWETRDVSGAPVNVVLGDSRDRIWVGTTSGVRLYTSTGWDMLTNVEGNKPTGYVYALAEDGEGRIWIGSADGLTLFDRNRYVVTFNTSNSNIPNNTVQALLVDTKNMPGGLWVGTADKLATFNGEHWHVYSTTHGLPSNYIYDLAQAKDGRVAVSTNNGLAFFNPTGDNFYTENVPGQSAINLPLTVDDQGRLWAGGSVRNSGGWQAYYSTNSGLIASTIKDNAADRAGYIWFGHWPITGGLSVRGTYLPPLGTLEPSIFGITPNSGSAGTVITITGSGFSANPADLDVAIGGTPVEVLSASETRITVRVGPETTSGEVSVNSRGRRVTYTGSGGRRAFCAVPVISSFDPTGGNNGVPISIRGTNFDADGIQVALGGGAQRRPFFASPTELRVYIQSGDGSGNVDVINHPLNCEANTASASTFRHFDLNIANIALNQGLSAYGLMANRPMLVSSFLTHSPALPRYSTERFEVDLIQIRLSDAAGHSITRTIPHSLTINAVPSLDPVMLRDTINAINVKDVTPSVPGFVQGNLTTQVTLWRSGQLVAQSSRTDFYRPNRVMRVLLVPFMPNDYTEQEWLDMQAHVQDGSDDLVRRIMPTGRVELVWSPIFVTVPPGYVEIGDVDDLFVQSHRMDAIRERWNEHHSSWPALIAFGVIQTRAKDAADTTPGQAFWPDLSAVVNLLAEPLDTLCDIGASVLEVLTLGDFDESCELEIPLYVGWASGDDDQISELFGHEFGHIFTLVSTLAPNGSVWDNISHSVNDEIDPDECGDTPSYYNRHKTLYAQPGVFEPVVNPISGVQFYPEPPPPNPDILDAYNRKRGKAIMSYACTRENDNVFYEPVDMAPVYAQYSLTSAEGFWRDLRATVEAVGLPNPPATNPVRPSGAAPGAIVGPRLRVSGVVSKTAPLGKLMSVEALGDNTKLSLGTASGYWLVQLGPEGKELSRYGVIPRFNTSPYTPTETGYFAATILRATDLMTIELRQGDTVLDSFHAGKNAPQVTIISPAGGEVFKAGDVPIVWMANDVDGDALEIAVDYSRDGAEWIPIGSSTGNNPITVPVFLLGGSTQARVRVTANDGLNKGSSTSNQFTVSNQSPRPFISQPARGTTILEGERLVLVGGANDNQDRYVADSGLAWSSSRDGALGTGNHLDVFLSVGVHTLTLTATNSVGLFAATAITVAVRGDYDYDGIADDEELADRLAPLSANNAYDDKDHDGLPNVMERRRNTNPNNGDSDGDGYSDADEILAITDPNDKNDNPGTLPPDQLAVNPSAIVLTDDLALDTPWAQQPVQVTSRNPASWTLSSNVDWLGASARSGTTPSGLTILAQVYKLNDGVHTGVLTFTSSTLKQTVVVPVTVTIKNKLAYCDVNRDGATNIADLQGVTARLGLGRGDLLYNYHYDLNRNEKIDTEDVQVVTECILQRKVYLPLVLKQ